MRSCGDAGVFFFGFALCFCNRFSLCNSDFPGTNYVKQVGLKLKMICPLLLPMCWD